MLLTAVSVVLAVCSLPTVAAAEPAALSLVPAAVAPFQPPSGADPIPPDRSPDRVSESTSRLQAQRRAEQQAAARAAREQAQARAKAAKRAAQLARAGQRAQLMWETRGRPTRMVIVRPDAIDLVTDGRLTRRMPRRAGDLTLTALNRVLPKAWLSITNGTAELAAAVVLTPRVTLDIGAEVTLLKLAGGAALSDAAALYTGGGRLVLHGVTVTSADPAAQQPMPASAGRPFIVVSGGGRLEATDATISDLGTTETDPQVRPGFQFNIGSSGSLVRTTFLRNSTGLQLVESQDVRLEDVTVSESVGDGLVLTNNHGTTITRVRAVRNGVRVAGAKLDHPITGITTAGNGRFGIAAIRLAEAHIDGVTTSGDAAGGLELA